MIKRLKAGDKFPELHTNDIHGAKVSIPASGVVHLQFRRFAGCPVCNLHLRSFVTRYSEIQKAGIQEVVIFHSTNAELLPYQGQFPFHVIGDPAKTLYRQYGVETSVFAVFHPGAWGAMLKGNLAKNKPKMPLKPKGGILGLPAEFLILRDGKIKASYYGHHADDHWQIDELLDLMKT